MKQERGLGLIKKTITDFYLKNKDNIYYIGPLGACETKLEKMDDKELAQFISETLQSLADHFIDSETEYLRLMENYTITGSIWKSRADDALDSWKRDIGLLGLSELGQILIKRSR